MSVAEQMSLAEVKDRLSQVVEDVETEHARVTITKHGRPAAVLISADDLQSLEETLAVLSDPVVMDQIRASREELGGGTAAQVLSKEQMMNRIRP
jgi:antitoxin YefM